MNDMKEVTCLKHCKEGSGIKIKLCHENCEYAGPRKTSFYTVRCEDGIMCQKIGTVICRGSFCPDWVAIQLAKLKEETLKNVALQEELTELRKCIEPKPLTDFEGEVQ